MGRTLRSAPLTAEEANRLAAACRVPREKRVVWVLLDTGMRLGELAALDSSRVALESASADVGGASGRRVVALTGRITDPLAALFSRQPKFGLSPRSIQRTIAAVASRAGLAGVGAARLRNTFGFFAAVEGMSPLELQRRMGLKDLASTAVYFELASKVRRPTAVCDCRDPITKTTLSYDLYHFDLDDIGV